MSHIKISPIFSAVRDLLPKDCRIKEYSVYMPFTQQPFCSLIQHLSHKKDLIYTIQILKTETF